MPDPHLLSKEVEVAGPVKGPATTTLSNRLVRLFLANPVVPLLAVVIPAFIVFVPGYATGTNMRNVALQSAVLALLVLGGGIVLISGNFDLSSEGTLVFTAVLGAWLMATEAPGSGWGVNPFIAIAAMIGVGLLVGLVNGVLVAVLGVNPFIVTLAMLLTLRGAAAIPTQSQTVVGLPDAFNWVGRSSLSGMSMIVFVSIALYVVFTVITSISVYGRHLYAVGGNLVAARENGIPAVKVVTIAYMISGALAAVAGWLSAARLDSASANMGDGIIFTAFAALVIGGVSLTGGKGSLWGALGGVFLLGSITNVINLLAINPVYINFIRGVVLIAAVLIIVGRIRVARRLGIPELT